jgi:hypothetical protein
MCSVKLALRIPICVLHWFCHFFLINSCILFLVQSKCFSVLIFFFLLSMASFLHVTPHSSGPLPQRNLSFSTDDNHPHYYHLCIYFGECVSAYKHQADTFIISWLAIAVIYIILCSLMYVASISCMFFICKKNCKFVHENRQKDAISLST